MTSKSNGIAARQNEDISITRLAAQRQLYNDAGKLDNVKIVLSVWLPLGLAVISEIWTDNIVLRSLSAGLSIIMMVVSLLIAKSIRKDKEMAASIQQAFDVYVYQMPWDKKLFGKEKNLNNEVAAKSKKILSDPEQRDRLLNWYALPADKLPVLEGIYTCQRENYNWDGGLRKKYRFFSILVITIISLVIVGIGIAKGEDVLHLILRFSFIVPLLQWMLTLVSELNKDLDRLEKMEPEMSSTEEKDMEDLQVIQASICRHRKECVKIPNLLYQVFKENDEDREHRAAMMEVNNTGSSQ